MKIHHNIIKYIFAFIFTFTLFHSSSSFAQQALDTSDANACTAAGGTLAGTNLFTDFNNGSFGTSPNDNPQNSPAGNPFPGSTVAGATYVQYDNTMFGEYTVVSNIVTARNRFQHGGGIVDPVNGIRGRYFHIDPENFTQFSANTISGVVPGNQYEISFWVADAELNAGQVSRVDVLVDGASTFITDPIDNPTTTQLVWKQYAFIVTAPSTSFDIQLQINDQSGNPISGGAGRDIHLNEINLFECVSPSIELAKSADISNLSTPLAVGDTLNFTFDVENTGNAALAGVAPVDTMNLGADGSGALISLTTGPTLVTSSDTNGNGRLDIEETFQYTGTFDLTQAAIDAGGNLNTATSTGNPVDNSGTDFTGIADEVATSDNDTTGDGVDGPADVNGNNPTSVTLTPEPSIELVKSVSSVLDTNGNGLFGDAGDTVNFEFTVENTGNTALAGITIADTGLAALAGTSSLTQPAVGFDGDLAIGEGPVVAGSATYILDATDVAAGSLTNTATTSSTAVATNASGNPDATTPLTGIAPVTDTSDTGSDPTLDTTDGSVPTITDPAGTATGDDPTVLTLPTPAPSIELVKSVSSVLDTNGNGLFGDAGDTVNFEFTVENTGNTALAGITIADTGLAALAGTSSLTQPAAGFDGDLAIGEGPIVAGSATYILDATDVAAGSLTNTATTSSTAVATNASGNPDATSPLTGIAAVTDTSDTGSDPTLDATDGSVPTITDPAGTATGDDPTVITLPTPTPSIQLTKSSTAPTILQGSDTTLPDVGDTITYTFIVRNTGNVQLTDIMIVDNNANVIGGPITTMDIGGSDETTFTAVHVITQDDIEAGGVENTATAIASSTAGAVEDISDTGDGSEASSDPDLGNDANGVSADDNDPTNDPTIVVLAPVTSTVAELVVTKTAAVAVTRIGDIVPYTITVANNLPIPRVNVSIVDLLPSGIIYRAGSGTIDGVQVEPTITGRRLVFSGQDIPANGSVTITLNAGVSASATDAEFVNQAFVGDPVTGNRISNIDTATVRREIEHVFDCGDVIGKVYDDHNRNGYQDEGEVGLPGVRVATFKGELITTDKHGRFHVPCASIPDADIGENFILKIDTRMLPTGYRITTENPRVVRLTRGKLTKINFGASISRVVRVNLNNAAFENSSAEPSNDLSDAFDTLINTLKKEPSVLRLSYQATQDDTKLGRKRLRTLSKLLQKRWRKSRGSYDLEIETNVITN